MMRGFSLVYVSLFLLWLSVISSLAHAGLAPEDTSNLFTLDFETLSDLEDVDNFYQHLGVTFEGAVVLSQGVSLNYLHFPPRSGINVIYDRSDGDGTITARFDDTIIGPVHRVGGYVTGNTNITMRAYNASAQLLGQVETGGPNFAPEGTPNMQLELTSDQHIARVVFSDSGNTYTVDDLYFEGNPSCNIQNVPLYRQGAATWGGDAYGGTTTNPWRHDDDGDGRFDDDPRDGIDNDGDGRVDEDTPETIAKWGCAMTSAAMIVSYHGAQQNGFMTDPRTLNNWLREPGNGGYSGGGLEWDAVARYARANGVALYFYEGRGYDDSVVNTYLCNGDPIVLGTNSASIYSNGHFLLATGGVNEGTWRVNDPGGGHFTTLDKNAYNSIRRYSTERTDPAALSFYVHSPVELLVTDPAGRRIGYDPQTGEYVNEILDGSYGIEQIGAQDGTDSSIQTLIFRTGAPLDGAYQVQLIGVDDGSYTVDFLASDSDDNSSMASLSAAVASTSQITLTLAYSTASSSAMTITLPVNQPPTAHAGGPYQATTIAPITLDASLSADPDGDPLVYRWDTNGDGIWDSDWSSDSSLSSSYRKVGQYTAYVEISDGLTLVTATTEVDVTGITLLPLFTHK